MMQRRSLQYRPPVTPGEIRLIRDRYIAGESTVKISRSMGLSRSCVLTQLGKAGVARRRTVDVRRNPDIRHDAFAIYSPDMAYWAGFLMADGNVCNTKVTLGLAEIDWGHIEKFRAFVGSPKPIRRIVPKGRFASSVSGQFTLNSIQMVADLAALGIVPRKSYCAEAPDSLAYDADFWRGMVDGDGSISVRKDGLVRLSLVGTKRIVEQFLMFIQQRSDTVAAVRQEARASWAVAVSGVKGAPVLRALYDNDRVALDRKKQKALSALGLL